MNEVALIGLGAVSKEIKGLLGGVLTECGSMPVFQVYIGPGDHRCGE